MPRYKLDLIIEAELPNQIVAEMVAQHCKRMVERELQEASPATKDALAKIQAAGITVSWGKVTRVLSP